MDDAQAERDRVKTIWAARAKRGLAREKQKPECEREKYRVIDPLTKRGTDLTPELEHVINCLKVIRPARVLDIGTGYGMMAKWLTQNGLLPGLDYIACDWLDDYIDLHEKNTGIRPIKWDGITLPFDDDAFEFIITYAVLLHVPPENLEAFFGEMVRVSSRWLYVHTAHKMKKSGVKDFDHDYLRLYDIFGVTIFSEVESIDGRRMNRLLEVP